VHKSSVNLEELCEEIGKIFEIQIEKKKLRFEIKVDRIYMNTDERRLK
jgi:signal transduction histidine kinase